MTDHPTFKCLVLTPEGQAHDDHVQSLVAPGDVGLFGVLANHAPMIVAIVPGILKMTDAEGEHFFVVDSGVLEVHPEGDVLLLVDRAQRCTSYEDAHEKVRELTHK